MSGLGQEMQGLADNYVCCAGSFGRISGFFLSSFLAFDIWVDVIKVSLNYEEISLFSW